MTATYYERHAPSPAAVAAALEGAELGSFWLAEAGPRPDFPALSGAVRADLAVVGGGYAGLWTAVLAKRRDPGLRVVLLEAARVGWAASGRNGGWVDASITHGARNGRSRWPEDYAELARLGLTNLDAMERDLADLGVEADWARTGALALALEPHQVDWLAEELEPGETALTAEEATARLHVAGALGGIATSAEQVALVQPAKLAHGLARAAAELGVELFERSRVTALSGTGPLTLTTAGGSVTADRVALATGAFPALLARNRLMTVPVYDYVLMTEPLSAAQREAIGWAGREGYGDLANQFHYSQITPEGRILWGGYDAVYRPGGRIRPRYEDDPREHAKLASHFLALFPQLEGIRFTHRWAGVIDTSTRFAAFYGTARRGRVAYAAGFTGLGVAATRFGAEVMLDLLAGVPTERTENRMVRERGLPFPPEPAATVGIQLARWSMERADHNQGRRNLFLRAMDAVGLGFDS